MSDARPRLRIGAALLGLACVLVGIWLLGRPFESLRVLTYLVAAALVLSGVGELADAARSRRPWLARLIGLTWFAIGVAAVAWPGITLYGLAVLVGIALVAGGVVKLALAVLGQGDERLLLGISGLTNAVVGGLALLWPSVTVLVLAVLFGFRTIVFGLGLLLSAVGLRGDEGDEAPIAPSGEGGAEPRREPSWGAYAVAVLGLLLAGAGVAASVAVHRATADTPGAFYDQPSELPDGPLGTVIRSEVIDDLTPGATSYRVLYTSTGFDGDPRAVSGIVVVPDGEAPPEGRRVVAFTHGTVGVAPRCAPSLTNQRVLVYEGLEEFVDAGYVVAATDYEGLGTEGPHPYLIGESEAMNALDSVRAAQDLDGTEANDEFVVWGHSQGGHASLFTGQFAAAYAPELDLLGVAAGAPAPDLPALFENNLDNVVGKVLISQALQAWTELFDVSLDGVVTPTAQGAVERIAENCLYTSEELASSAPGTAVLDLTFLEAPPWEVEPWKTIAAENAPGQTPIDVPILLTQGDADPLIDPALTEQLRERLCAQGEVVELLSLPGVEHVEAGHEAAPAVAEWVADRFAGAPAPDSCEP